MWGILIGGLLILHGLINAAIWATPAAKDPDSPFDASHSWLLGDARVLGVVLALAAAAALLGAGVGMLGHHGWWRPWAVAGAVLSLALVIVFFNPWFAGAAAINIGVIVALGWAHWPTADAVGA
jgi:hypothetical protein